MYIYMILLDVSRHCVACLMTCVRDTFVDRKFSVTFFCLILYAVFTCRQLRSC
jgi:hypothetical protein